MTAPTGTSPARAARSASSSASRMYNSSSERTASSKTIAEVLYHNDCIIINKNNQKLPFRGAILTASSWQNHSAHNICRNMCDILPPLVEAGEFLLSYVKRNAAL
jgi:hypothetical protein